MTPEFTPISALYIKEYKNLLALGRCRASDYNFGNVWGWREHFGLEWRLREGLCWIRQTRPQTLGWAPVGDWKSSDWVSSAILRAGGSFIRIPEELAALWSDARAGRTRIRESRGQWDYQYNARELATLSGNRFHKKKNLVNQFVKLYPFRYLPMTENSLEEVLDLQKKWLLRLEEKSPALEAEDLAVRRVLELWESIPGITGGLIRIRDEAVAYTVGEETSPGILSVHFEKGLPGFKGVYQAINHYFSREALATGKFHLINRGQDLDDPGLRQAKESYNPVEYVKKCSVDILPE
ncbi:MAG: phosphatidylglycerol lysyltransferase domain-containing protein [Desulfovibrionaceae bacterium]|nr:phosphatidylglycerol lysyltransferase domain-containing protein [Desulfovibrionaceae bacterium]